MDPLEIHKVIGLMKGFPLEIIGLMQWFPLEIIGLMQGFPLEIIGLTKWFPLEVHKVIGLMKWLDLLEIHKDLLVGAIIDSMILNSEAILSFTKTFINGFHPRTVSVVADSKLVNKED